MDQNRSWLTMENRMLKRRMTSVLSALFLASCATAGEKAAPSQAWVSLAQTPTPAAAQQPTDQQAAFDAYVASAMEKWGVPGVAIAYARDGKVFLVKGYGVRTIGRPEKVDENTVFAIASLTKAFTAAGAAVLWDEEKLTFNDPVVKFLPTLKFYDERVTSEVTLRDLLAQRTCLAPKDIFTWNSPFSHEETMRRVRYIPPECTFRDRFVYNNMNYVIAGDATAAAAGVPWEQLITDRILKPLGMNNTTTSTAQAAGWENVATPYFDSGERMTALPLYDEGVSAPAGSIHSSAADMAKWMTAQLGGGVYEGKAIWSPTVNAAMQGVQMASRPGPRDEGGPPSPAPHGYGFGWGVGEYRGKRYIDHTGQSDGMYALIAMMPQDGLGIVVLTNTSKAGLPEAIAYRWLDMNLGLADYDWAGEMYASSKDFNGSMMVDNVARNVPRTLGTKMSLPASGYIGVYRQDLLGDVTVSAAANGDLSIKFLAKTGRLRHWQDDTFQIDWGEDYYYAMTSSFVTFEIDSEKRVSSLKIGVDENAFARAGP
jgi:CubicO group peptidase (beta-lactamase class C family)